MRLVRGRHSVGLYARNTHWFLYQWGVTIRLREDGEWTHLACRIKRNDWRHDPSRCSRQFDLETWKTAPGPSSVDRVAGSKRYFRVKVAA